MWFAFYDPRSMRVAHFALLAFLSGCSTCATSGKGAAKEDMQLVPVETQVVFMANPARMRNTAMWRKLLDVRDGDEQTKKQYTEFVQKCGLDPFTQIDSVFLAMPQPSGDAKEFAVIMRGKFDEAKLVSCAREQAKKDGQELAESDYNGHKLYTSTKSSQAFATFLDAKTVVIAGKEWVKKVLDSAGGKGGGQSAKDNGQLMELVKRAKTSDALWGAGLVTQSTRDQLKADPQLAPAASMKDLFGSVDFASGVGMEVSVDLGSDADAQGLTGKIQAQVAEAKKSPQLMMAGLSAFLDGVKIESKAATFHLTVTLNQQQVDDLINRVKGLLASFGGALKGGGGTAPQMPTP
jgi:hypothetical protein